VTHHDVVVHKGVYRVPVFTGVGGNERGLVQRGAGHRQIARVVLAAQDDAQRAPQPVACDLLVIVGGDIDQGGFLDAASAIRHG
jgi:hypothetical protein